ncbi:MAG: LysE family transporter [Euryarchaeota archaeon]|nr:LysE family transporter [Euryarchaeota archaeon]
MLAEVVNSLLSGIEGYGLAFFLFATVVISLSGVLMPGPVLAVSIAKGHRDRLAGMKISLGHALLEVPLILLIYAGVASAIEGTPLRLLSLAGGVLLIYMGVEMLRSRREVVLRGRDLPYGATFAGFATSFANPYFLLWWLTVGALLVAKASSFGILGLALFIIVHEACDFLWYTLVSLASFSSRRVLSAGTQELLFVLLGGMLLLFGAWFLGSAFK